MRHLRAVNQKARRIDDYIASLDEDVVALQGPGQGGRSKLHRNPGKCPLRGHEDPFLRQG